MKSLLRSALAVSLLAGIGSTAFAAKAPTPSEFLGFEVGADKKLADYRQIAKYFQALKAASPRVDIEVLGKTTLGEDMFLAVISSEENIKNQKAIRENARRLADPRGLSDAEVQKLTHDGKLVLLVTCNIHSTEIGASQMAMEWAHALATATDPATVRRLNDVVLLLVPSLNPDGQIMETEWYRKNLGTKFEGSRMPWLYHHYVGHDDNRDWYMLTQKETQAMTRAVYKEWFPQVWLDEHQMGSNGPRIFVPPYADPVDVDIHPLVWREVNVIGTNMALRLEQNGKSGVIYGFSYDAYWPGGTKNTAWYKNISGLLTEVASARMATPIELPAGELAGGRKGLIEYGPQTNFPNPWPGGKWRLRDIMDYERIASDALLESCSDRREDFLRDMAAKSRAAIAAFGANDAWRIPASQHDHPTAIRLARLMEEHGVEVKAAENGDIWIPLAQPYGKFVQEMFSEQRYPEVKLVPGKDIVRPYDVTAWTLPIMMNVAAERATLPSGLKPFAWKPAGKAAAEGKTVAIAPGSPENFKVVNAALRGQGSVSIARAAFNSGDHRMPAGTFLLDAAAARAASGAASETGVSWTAVPGNTGPVEKLQAPRVGLYKPWAASMDEGWTRWVLEQYGFDPKSLDNKTVRAGKLNEKFDAIVLPNVERETIASGKPRREEGEMRYFAELPPDYAGGLEKEGAKGLKEFVEAGGTLIAFAAASDYVTEEFNVPVRNTLARVRSDDFSCPGSLLRVKVTQDHPVTYGLPADLAVFYDSPVAFATQLPGMEMERWVLASYPEAPRDILASGWIHGEDRLARRAAAVAMTYGKGKIVLLGFRPQNRAQTLATFPFIFNSLYWSVAK
ncbi:MAG TPA: M14 family metallopeptidase [Thermoanaerobaculia bacterium]|nr:M14 family metallopeptidase [Thermoanaerobaculia bacterium]